MSVIILVTEKIEPERLFEFLVGLSHYLDDVHGRILGRRPLPSIWEVFIDVKMEENQQRVMLEGTSGGDEFPSLSSSRDASRDISVLNIEIKGK